MNYDIPKYKEYTDCMVAFIDILGFDSRVKNINSEEDFFEIGKLLYALTETERGYNADKTIFKNLTVTAISDSIIITMPYHDPNCAMAITIVLKKFQYDLISTSFATLLRGYLTRRHVYHKDRIIFGKGYSEAYRKEREIGHAPRIVFDPRIIDDGRQKVLNYKGKVKVDHVFNYLMRDASDGYYFIDYLKPIGLQTAESRAQLIEERSTIKVFIENCLNLYKDNEKIIRKYEWLNNYISLTEHYFENANNA
ncbi:MAG: hypothetical protein NTY86_01920 [Deltaproteobacteria bacterium]|nr:hypothetical protein [Deltaproteobacteria bacterium]